MREVGAELGEVEPQRRTPELGEGAATLVTMAAENTVRPSPGRVARTGRSTIPRTRSAERIRPTHSAQLSVTSGERSSVRGPAPDKSSVRVLEPCRPTARSPRSRHGSMRRRAPRHDVLRRSGRLD